MKQRWKVWTGILIASVTVLLWAFVFFALDQAEAGAAAESRNSLMLYAFAGSIGFAAVSVLMLLDLQKRLLRPVESISRDVRTLLDAKQIDRSLRMPTTHGLGQLPATVEELIDNLRGVRREMVRAMATATARMEQEKSWLEVILLELVREGVVVCSADDRVLLYNRPAAQLFRDSHALGLGRSLFGLVAEEPVRHALERLDFRLQSGSRDLGTRFVCATRGTGTMLQARAALIIEAGGKPSGYVLTLEDISSRLEEIRRDEAIRKRVTRELRGPIANLRAASENLVGFPEMDEKHRHAFQEIVLSESTRLSDDLEELAENYRGRSEGFWPVTEIYSRDLLECIARHLDDSGNASAGIVGEDQWLSGDSHSLMLALEKLIDLAVQSRGLGEIVLESGVAGERTWIEVRYQGAHVPSQELRAWLAEPVDGLPDTNIGQVLEQHGSEPWGEDRGNGEAALRVPLQAATTALALDDEQLPPRPEFYDFDLMFAHNVSGELAERPLRELSYVVFDTETTGLKPTGGDEIISIAGVRVTQGRVMSKEYFESLIDPGRPIPADSIKFHGITDDKIQGQPAIGDVLPKFQEFTRDAVLVAHNAAFDMKFLRLKEADCGIVFDNPVVDTLLLSVLIEGSEEDHSLDGICERLDLEIEDRHSALGDAVATAHVLVHLLDRLEAMGIKTFGQVMKASNMEAELRFRAGHF